MLKTVDFQVLGKIQCFIDKLIRWVKEQARTSLHDLKNAASNPEASFAFESLKEIMMFVTVISVILKNWFGMIDVGTSYGSGREALGKVLN